MKLLLDEMYSAVLAAQLRSRGYDVVSIHDPDQRGLEGAADAEVFTAAVTQGRTVVTENVPDFRRLETIALADGAPCPGLIYTTNRQFPRGDPVTAGRMVIALAALLADSATVPRTLFLKPLSE